ncbi:DUF488 domain-containing protein [Neobacillus thermocopriae]|uniref:DUF488 domain-containing protein n=1 Tax=Neobacillus thermocopriae TaxID=1215031 RepID=A0A6B3TR04_9BACI|nr:DUF488 domain-containing protein [Neobacillus thermocopriae]MED3624748.1 DUF488 domain-containing protein [Neobacillus thermocopriae]MED3713102.1 DUF488 domain-containing protein [Neobacillus thermocopriae]NEX78521.1 DUF488 domain-containing protein [Neobacillus thermocopriae]
METIFLKRIYEPFDENDGYRILVDRLWPRGISKEKARLNEWMKEIAPSNTLRQWFCHKPELFEEFRIRYVEELRTDETKQNLMKQILETAKSSRVTLLYGAKDPTHNHAVILFEELMRSFNAKDV